MITRIELEQVKQKIIENPENLQMTTWHCGTAHCIGGWLETLYPKKYRISNKYIDGGKLSRNNMPDTLTSGNNEDRQSGLFSVVIWDTFVNKNFAKEINKSFVENFDNLKPELKQKYAILAIDSYIEKYNIN